MKNGALKIWVLFAAIFFGLLPVFGYWFLADRMPKVSAEKAKQMLADPKANAALIDVRDQEEYDARHIEGAQSWPFSEIKGLKSADQIPQNLKDKKLLLICNSGILSAFAAKKLGSLGISEVWSVRGGMDEWTASFSVPCPLQFCRMKSASGKTEGLPTRRATRFEQWMLVFTSFAIKPLYILLSFALLIAIRKLKSLDMVALRWALVSFFVGEVICAINYLFFTNASYLLEYLHNCGMVLSFGFASFALFEALDLRLIRYSDPEKKCAGLDLCHACIKYTQAPCGFKRLFLFLAPALAILCLMPFCAELKNVSYNSVIWGVTYNFMEAKIFQIFELRYCPAIALIFFLASFLVLWFKKNNPVPLAKILFSIAMGFFSFGFFRMFLFYSYQDNILWFSNWEEITEFLYMAGVAASLWIFRKSIFQENHRQPASRPSPGPGGV